MNSREDQIILIEPRHTGLVAGRVRRIERELRQETLPWGIPARNLFKLDQVSTPRHGFAKGQFDHVSLAVACVANVPEWPVLARTAEGGLAAIREPAPGELYRYHLDRLAWMDELVAYIRSRIWTNLPTADPKPIGVALRNRKFVDLYGAFPVK
jgi:hypothetical protein